MRKVVLTGAAGYVAGRMLSALRQRYDLTLLDVRTADRGGEEVEGIIATDLVNPDRDAYREHFRGADAVVHCGLAKPSRPEDRSWASETRYRSEIDNINMAYNIYQTCLEEDVRRVVVISSNHATDYYERLIRADRMEFVTPDLYPLSDNFYGWAKASYELLGFVFASAGLGGKKLQNVHLRIGSPVESGIDQCGPEDLKKMHRALGAYLSARDQVQLVVKSIETENIEDENGVPFQIFYGVSNNTHNFWSIANARKAIGYAPEDDSQVLFADRIARIITAAQQARQHPG